MKKIITLLVGLSLFLLTGCGSSENTVKFGAAGEGGMYYTFAEALTGAITSYGEDIHFEVRETAGSAANLRLLSEGYVQLAIAQADLTDAAYHGTGDYKDNPLQGYSAVASLYTEACQIVVRADSDIDTIDDLLNKTVSVGEEESGSERNAQQILQIYGLSDDLVKCENYNYKDGAKALANGDIDAMFITAGAPNEAIQDITDDCSIRLLSLDQAHIKKLKAAYNFYTTYTVKAGTYSGQKKDVSTVGVQSLLLASDDLDNETVAAVTELMFRFHDTVEKVLPEGQTLSEKEGTKDVSIPFHRGAAGYYEDQDIAVESK